MERVRKWSYGMTEREIADWEREIRHAERMQEQRKSKSAEIQINVYEVKDNDNEINNQ